jgi:hypothetical protein
LSVRERSTLLRVGLIVVLLTTATCGSGDPGTPPPPPGTWLEAATVRIASRPTGAGVWRDGLYLGETPLEIPRPTGHDYVTLELRRQGFETRRFVLLDSTRAPELHFTLRANGGSSPTQREIVQEEPPALRIEPPLSAHPAEVRIASTPTGAEVREGEVLLGVTPLSVPRPEGGRVRALELRTPGFEPRRFAISSATLASELEFTLQEEMAPSWRVARSRPTSWRRRSRTPPPAPETRMRRTQIQAEGVGPWAK